MTLEADAGHAERLDAFSRSFAAGLRVCQLTLELVPPRSGSLSCIFEVTDGFSRVRPPVSLDETHDDVSAAVGSAVTLAEHRRSFHAALRPASSSFTAHAAIDAVRRALPRNGLLSFDVGAHTHQIASQWTAHAPKSFHITNGWSSMGFGLPGAIAAKLARPDLPVVCLLGDGCFQMTCGEVATAKRLGLTLPVVVLDDRWLALIKVKQIKRQFPLYGTELQTEAYREPPAHYFGVPAMGASSTDALEAAVTDALDAHGPTVIEAVVDSEHYVDTVYD